MVGDVSMASAWSGTMPKPVPLKGTQSVVLRKKQLAGLEVEGAVSRCQSVPGSGCVAIHFDEPLSMSSKKRTGPPGGFPADFTCTSSIVHPVKAPRESDVATFRSEPKRNWSWIGCVTVENESEMEMVWFTHDVPRFPVYEASVSHRAPGFEPLMRTQPKSKESSDWNFDLKVSLFPVVPARLIG